MTTRHDRPAGGELATAVATFLEREILPTLDDHRLRFRTLVAMNALSIVARECPPARSATDEEWTLARRLRAGDIRDGDVASVRGIVREKLLVASPRYLDRYR